MTASPNVAAEVRGIESGRNCRWVDGRFVVLSEGSGRTYELTVSALGDRAIVSCTCPAGIKGRQVPAGSVKCKHAGLVMRRLERQGFAFFSIGGLWCITPALLALAGA